MHPGSVRTAKRIFLNDKNIFHTSLWVPKDRLEEVLQVPHDPRVVAALKEWDEWAKKRGLQK